MEDILKGWNKMLRGPCEHWTLRLERLRYKDKAMDGQKESQLSNPTKEVETAMIIPQAELGFRGTWC